jgi:hypothetical protein
MSNNVMFRVVRLNKVRPEIYNHYMPERNPNLFGSHKRRFIGDTGEAVLLSDCRFGWIGYRSKTGVYSEDEVELVTQRELELERQIITLLQAFPNRNPGDAFVQVCDQVLADVTVPKIRVLLRNTRMQKMLDNKRRLLRIEDKIWEQLLQLKQEVIKRGKLLGKL